MRNGLDLYNYSPGKGITRRKHGRNNVSIPLPSSIDTVFASCGDDEAIILADRKGMVRICESSSGDEICRVQTKAGECSMSHRRSILNSLGQIYCVLQCVPHLSQKDQEDLSIHVGTIDYEN